MSIAWNDILNNEGGLSVRTKLNNAIAALVNFVNSPSEEDNQSKWEEESADDVKPKNDKGVVTPRLQVGDKVSANSAGLFIDDVKDSYTWGAQDLLGQRASDASMFPRKVVRSEWGKLLRLTIGHSDYPELSALYMEKYSGHTGIKPAGFNSDGELVPWDEEEDGESPQGNGSKIVTSEAHSVSFMAPNILCYFAGNTDIHLPNLTLNDTLEVVVRKCVDDANAVAIHMGNVDIIMGGQTGHAIETIEYGAWVRLKAVPTTIAEQRTIRWYVLEDGGTWAVDNT